MSNAVETLKYVYKDGRTFRGPNDVYAFLTTQGYNLARQTAIRFDGEARNQLAAEGIAIQDPTSGNNWTRTGMASSKAIEKSRRRAVRYLRTFVENLSTKLNVDAQQHDASAMAVQNDALLAKAVEFIQVLSDYES